MKIRFAKKEDKTQIFSLQDELLTAVALAKNEKPKHKPIEKVGSELFDKTFHENIVKYLVAEEKGKIIGLATLIVYPIVRRGQYRAKLEELVVSEKMRGKGIGTLLLEAVLKYCKAHDIPTMVLNSEVDLSKAHKFYEKHGGKFTEKMFRFDL